MPEKLNTAERILKASRHLFNQHGYAATTLTEIAASLGISQGNLTYHFPTKQVLADRLQQDARQRMQSRRRTSQAGEIADDYVEHLLFAMELTWENRFLLRDRSQFSSAEALASPSPEMTADLEELCSLVARIEDAGYFRQDLAVNIEVLSHTLWIVSRYWMDYLRELEGCSEITWQDQERGIEHHYAVLLPCLTAPARRKFEHALKHAASFRSEQALE